MKKLLLVANYALLLTVLVGCARLKQITQLPIQIVTAGIDVFGPYFGPKAKIMFADFEIKAGKATNDVAVGLREALVNTLIESNRFLVSKPADLIILIALTEFEPQISAGRAGVGGGGGAGSGLWGGLLGTSLNKTHVSLDIRVIDPAITTALAQTTVQGQATDDIEKAKRICIAEAARYLSQAIPANYYKY